MAKLAGKCVGCRGIVMTNSLHASPFTLHLNRIVGWDKQSIPTNHY